MGATSASADTWLNFRGSTQIQAGQASWYGPGFQGRRTASGERFNTNDLTAAHRTLPFGTRVLVKNRQTGQSVVVRINDRGPYVHGRVIDLSRASAQAIGISGTAPVELSRL
ncbi:septal ring lytic transglycosylase RlpA family protein [Microvirga terricola]|uniref:septal ring lytic transglycosylase RlpA family protein n=1 Tax=Microvirga terricola TaxID=2719797 RepID=UPI0031B9FA5C